MGVMAAVTKWNTRVMSRQRCDRRPVKKASDRKWKLAARRQYMSRFRSTYSIKQETSDRPSHVFRPERMNPDLSLLNEAANRLAAAKKVVIYCGGGAVHANAGKSIVAIAEALNAPIMTSFMGKGAVPEDHPLCVGALWEAGNEVDDLLQADVLLVIGSKLGAQATWMFKMGFPAELIRVDDRSPRLNATPTPRNSGRCSAWPHGNRGPVGRSKRKSSLPVSIKSARSLRAQIGRIELLVHADRRDYIDALRRAIPRDGILVTDMTQMSYVGCYLYQVYEPRTYMFP